jgi:hypothetical protein
VRNVSNSNDKVEALTGGQRIHIRHSGGQVRKLRQGLGFSVTEHCKSKSYVIFWLGWRRRASGEKRHGQNLGDNRDAHQ